MAVEALEADTVIVTPRVLPDHWPTMETYARELEKAVWDYYSYQERYQSSVSKSDGEVVNSDETSAVEPLDENMTKKQQTEGKGMRTLSLSSTTVVSAGCSRASLSSASSVSHLLATSVLVASTTGILYAITKGCGKGK
eukprot:TRINITY_DN57316_c0_g1_i1.p1 TRINITY_DN57316_c0_g1~~TRINITY_DN57316_c0_g1_i1.p1  ORF type:complete len:139 (-),score=15.69 TRINITY_DN57316_c0_g1_i1:183-599(-)